MATLDFLFSASRMIEEDIPLHQHTCHELVYYVSGTGTTTIGGEDYTYQPGHFAYIHSSTPHNERHSEHTEVICVGFSTTNHLLARPIPAGIYRDSSRELPALLERMLHELSTRRSHFRRMLNALTEQLVIELDRQLHVEQEEDYFQYTLNYINENFTQRIDFASLAAMAGYSYHRYRHLFKEKTGRAPVQYILERKLELAKRLLRTTALPITVIAMESGFSSDSQFCHLFRRECGSTPSQYRSREGMHASLR